MRTSSKIPSYVQWKWFPTNGPKYQRCTGGPNRWITMHSGRTGHVNRKAVFYSSTSHSRWLTRCVAATETWKNQARTGWMRNFEKRILKRSGRFTALLRVSRQVVNSDWGHNKRDCTPEHEEVASQHRSLYKSVIHLRRDRPVAGYYVCLPWSHYRGLRGLRLHGG
jgi:hypothetical protein